jgi:hypothetical protein
MHRVLEDVKSVQREINSIQGKVERTITVTDEIIFRVTVNIVGCHTDTLTTRNEYFFLPN